MSGGGTLALLSDANVQRHRRNRRRHHNPGPATGLRPANTVRFELWELTLADDTVVEFTVSGTFNNGFALTADPTIDTGGVTITLTGKIEDGSNAGVVDVIGGGTLILTNTTNSYSGARSSGTTARSASPPDLVLGNVNGDVTLGDATTGTLAVFASARLLARQWRQHHPLDPRPARR